MSLAEFFLNSRQAVAGNKVLIFSLFRRQGKTYRSLSFIAALIVATVSVHDFFLGNIHPLMVGIAVLSLFLSNTLVLFLRPEKNWLSPSAIVSLVLLVLLASIAYGEHFSLYWLYPVLVALPVLLRGSFSLCLCLLTGIFVVPYTYLNFESAQAMVICLSLLMTWLCSCWFSYIFIRQSEKLKKLSITDALTGAYNRRHFNEMAEQACELMRRHKRPTTILLFDIDKFKEINDEFGHEAGDKVLVGFVRLLNDRVRAVDQVYRYGGEEFVVMLSETTANQAQLLAEHIRSAIENTKLLHQRVTTVSCGICEVDPLGDVDSWMRSCDKALYQAKHQGRNQVVTAEAWSPIT